MVRRRRASVIATVLVLGALFANAIIYLFGILWPHARFYVLLFAFGLAVTAHAAEHRSRDVTREFQYLHPCPSTGKPYGACSGFVKDHINPLCNGGPDAVSNMQWQTVEDAKIKDRWERRICRH